ncbi:MAG: sigma-54-dependent Fis family transcriptional regulator [Deltaproteobacteria bacterium]|nr:sigma-54-dependent Fis family transcriptional regulator [Deltaproteobacteria bacterium]
MEKRKILIVDDEAVVREGSRRIFSGDLYQVETAANGYAALELLDAIDFDVVVTDLKMPGMGGLEVLKAIREKQPDLPVVVITGYSTVDNAVEVMKSGAFDYISKPFTPDQLKEKVGRALEHRSLLIETLYHTSEGFDGIVGESREMQKIYRRILQVAPSDSTILVTGESGTGKELVARAIHRHSGRREHPFVAVDCTALAENLLESELFGHVKGSFTGAVVTKTGLFKVADGGTLFMDEVANISLATQAKLLRVLQARKVTPVGGTQPIPIDIRLVAATNRTLRKMVAEGSFREDLFFRLNIIPIDLPPLRERKGDLPLLIGHFLKTFSEEIGKEIRGLAPDAMALLEEYGFPGNVRELENTIERAVVLTDGPLIQKDDLELQWGEEDEGQGRPAYVPRSADELKETKRQIRERAVEPVEKAFVLDALRRNKWNVTRAAEETGMLRPNFQALMKKVGISLRDEINASESRSGART